MITASLEDRLNQCKLTALETRRSRGNQIEVFQIMCGFEGTDKSSFFKDRKTNITLEQYILDIQKYLFS